MSSRLGAASAVVHGMEYKLHWGDQFLVAISGDGRRTKVYNGRLAPALGSVSLEVLLEREIRKG